MFLVLNKEKISAYFVSVLTVCFLFFIASNTTNNNGENTKPVSVKVETHVEDSINDDVTDVNNDENSGNTNQQKCE